MAGSSNVIVLEPDARAAAQLRVGFAREGIAVVAPAVPEDLAALALDAATTGIALVGGAGDRAVDLVRRTRQLLPVDVPIVVTGGGPRDALVAAGADEVVTQPAFLRDVVTLARVFRGQPAAARENVTGDLAETTGLYTLVRAFASLGRSAVLTLIRGLRRGEIRFYRGEITSAHVGLIHGQAAFHQLLLWTDARFELSREDAIVRRAQIPLGPDELFADAERFLEGVREAAERLSPSMMLEQNMAAIVRAGADVPVEIQAILRMFDGHHVLADVLEDSPYRVFETLRIAQTALDAGLVTVAVEPRPRASWRAVLAIDEWLVGSETRDAVVERTAELDTKPIEAAPRKGKKARRKKQRRPATPLPVAAVGAVAAAAAPKIDWHALVPRATGDVGNLAGVVPAYNASGEIELASRDAERERLEALMDTDKRAKIFPTEIGIEPSIVVAPEATSPLEIGKPAEVVAPKAEVAAAKTEAEAPAPAPPPTDVEAIAEAEARAQIGAFADGAPAVIARPAEIEEARAYAANALADAAREPAVLRDPPPDGEVTAAAPNRPSDATSLVKDLLAVAPSVDPEPAKQSETSVLAGADPIVADLVAAPPAKAAEAAEPSPAASGEITAQREIVEPRDVAEPSPAASGEVTAQREIAEPPPAASAEIAAAPASAASGDGAAAPAPATSGDGAISGDGAAAPSPAASGEIAASGDVAAAPEPSAASSIEITAPRLLEDAEVTAPRNREAPATPVPETVPKPRESTKDLHQGLSDAEAAFFNSTEHAQPAPPETFDDLDEGYQKPTFWDRVFNRKPRR